MGHPDFKNVEPIALLEPDSATTPFVFNSPHSGCYYPKRFLDASNLDAVTIRKSEDLFVDELFAEIPKLGAPLLKANFPRAYLDLNREPYELDPKMFEGTVPAYANIRSIRVAGGLGTIARLVSESQEIYRGKVPIEEALSRIELLYKPYHATLRKLLARTHVKFGQAYLVDCHSMPSGKEDRKKRSDFVLGDRYGTSCNGAVTEVLGNLLSDCGYSVERNKPYAGGFITEHYGRPSTGLHALQVEINRGLYADEQNFLHNANFEIVQKDLTSVFAKMFEIFSKQSDLHLAAE